ncbi:hypothetical protein [Streptococcus sciuri]|uniref:Uncharacterized protein n=1 Tax=Streptococcus sciuri TaxID=2973939 RepID=A0ABT2F5J9_9STRE|nr:hypothetical protein [Streptococcus sciuri]MCS4487750.1 hypothetical protein [Streptococcus sciuri]
MKDRIHQLQISLAQTTNPIKREQLQKLVDEAVDEYETYLYRLQKEEEERERQLQLFEKEQETAAAI